jgi:heptosyltransferase II
LGDVVLSLAALRDVRQAFPGARLSVLARPKVAEIYGAVPEVDGVLLSLGLLEDRRQLKDRFDLAILFPNSLGSALPPFLARVPARWGFSTDGRGLLLTRRARIPARVRGQSQVYYYRAMLESVGVGIAATPNTALACPPAWRTYARETLGPGPWIALSPGAAFGGAKRWRPEGFAAAADTLARERGASVVVVGTAGERAIGEEIAARVSARVRVLCGQTTLPELVGVLAHSDLLLTNDSGAMHVAAALGTPLVAVFGPTDWRETHPVGSRTALVRSEVHCAPCMLRECPIDHRCMQRVSVDAVVAAAKGLS